MFTTKTLLSKGLEEPKDRSFLPLTGSYCKLWSVGNFNLRITKKGDLQVFEPYNGELIKVIKDEKVLDAFIIFALH